METRKKVITGKLSHWFSQDPDEGFSLLEMVVAMGILIVLTVGGVLAYNGITQNAREGATRAAAKTVYTGAVAYSADNDSSTTPQDAATEYNTSQNTAEEDKTLVAQVNTLTDGSICAVATFGENEIVEVVGASSAQDCVNGTVTSPSTPAPSPEPSAPSTPAPVQRIALSPDSPTVLTPSTGFGQWETIDSAYARPAADFQNVNKFSVKQSFDTVPGKIYKIEVNRTVVLPYANGSSYTGGWLQMGPVENYETLTKGSPAGRSVTATQAYGSSVRVGTNTAVYTNIAAQSDTLDVFMFVNDSYRTRLDYTINSITFTPVN